MFKNCFLKDYNDKTRPKLIAKALMRDVYNGGVSKLANYRFKPL